MIKYIDLLWLVKLEEETMEDMKEGLKESNMHKHGKVTGERLKLIKPLHERHLVEDE